MHDRPTPSSPVADVSRRSVLGGLLGLAGLGAIGLGTRRGLAQPVGGPAGAGAAAASPARRVLRIAHLTDVHVQPERKADAGFALALRRVGEMADKPDVIFNTGDSIFDAMATGIDRATLQWDLWTKALRDGPRIDWFHCLGNHDILGTTRGKSKLTGTEPGYGKAMACEKFGIAKPYYRFDRAGWRFIVLDSVMVVGESYDGKLDDEQLEWLSGELAAVPKGTPVMILSHIPILTVTTLCEVKAPKNGAFEIKTSVMGAEWPALRDLFRKHRCVKACISGHIHQIDRVEFEGVTYLCGGAVSGSWWKGPRLDCDNGFNVLDLYADGRVESKYETIGWKAE